MQHLTKDTIITILNILVDCRNFGAVNRHINAIYKQTDDCAFFSEHKLTLYNIYGHGPPKLLSFIGCGCIDCIRPSVLYKNGGIVWSSTESIDITQQLHEGFKVAIVHNNIRMVAHLLHLRSIWHPTNMFYMVKLCISYKHIDLLHLIFSYFFNDELIRSNELRSNEPRSNENIVISFAHALCNPYNFHYALLEPPTHDDQIMYTKIKARCQILWMSCLIADLCIAHLFDIADAILMRYDIHHIGKLMIMKHAIDNNDVVLLDYAAAKKIMTSI